MFLRVKFILFILCIGVSTNAHAWEQNFIPKLGYLDWTDRTFILKNSTITFENSTNKNLGFQYRFITDVGVSASFESLFVDTQLIADSAGNPRDVNIYQHHFIVQYHLFRNQPVRPYIGAGLGQTTISIHSGTNVKLTGFSTQLSAGVEFLFHRRIGLGLGYKRTIISANDAAGNEIETNSDMLALELIFRSGDV